MGIQAVPCYVFGGRFALSGAQEPNVFLPLFDLAEAGADAGLGPGTTMPVSPALTG
jgi:predicted DsbA family dithiol-disulfide isomerase